MKNLIKPAKSRSLLVFSFLSLLVLAACGGGESNTRQLETEQQLADASSTIDESPSTTGSTTIAGISFTPPTQWKTLPASGMRQAQYRLQPVAGDSAEGEVNIYYFGPESGGGVEANLQRWVGQITLPDGSDPSTVAKMDTFTADGMAGHIVALNGSYKSGGGRPMGGNTQLLPGYRLVGVVLEGPEGSLFFKLTGPLATAEIMEVELMKMVREATS